MNRLIFLLMMIPIVLPAQIINVEKLRTPDSKPFQGHIDASFAATRNANRIYRWGGSLSLDWKLPKQRWLFLASLDQLEVNQNVVQSQAYSHLRYNYDLTPRITSEAFSQVQFNRLLKIDLRSLSGAGLRFKIVRADTAKTRLFLGIAGMYEYEETAAPDNRNNRDWRLSTYLSSAFIANETLSITHISYFQPRPDELDDYRISTETQFRLRITKKISFTLAYTLAYDSRPPEDATDTFSTFSNILRYDF
ncbi:MAG: DUF481 domain-containing protein [Bacteroidota bacterium]